MKMVWMALMLAGALMAQPAAASAQGPQSGTGPQMQGPGGPMEMDAFGPGDEFQPEPGGPMQGGPGGRMRGMGPGRGMGMMAPGVDAVKEALGLTDAQITQLKELRKAQATAARKAHLQLMEKQEALREALEVENPDALKVGTLMVESKKMRQANANAPKELHTKALAVLSAEQNTKLATLVKAEGTTPALREACALGLADRPVGMRGMGPGMRRGGRQGGRRQQGGPGAPPPAQQ
jgi:Spy/CpxP family protein refolding chaperone